MHRMPAKLTRLPRRVGVTQKTSLAPSSQLEEWQQCQLSCRNIATGRLLPSGARLVLPSSSSSISLPRRPLSFPLGTVLGFLLGFAAAGLLGYARLIELHAKADAGIEAGLSGLENRFHQVKASLAAIESLGQFQERSEQAARTAKRLELELAETNKAMHRMEQRIVGLEEDSIYLKQRVLKLGKSRPCKSPSSIIFAPVC